MHGHVSHILTLPGGAPPLDQVSNYANWPYARANYLPHIQQRLLLYGAHSKISHTHCLMALSPHAVREVDSVLEGISRQIWSLPPTFPKVGLHALLEDLGLNIPLVGED